MFDTNELDTLDEKYFRIICKDSFDVTIRSRNTGHFWSLHSPDCPENNVVVIFYSHHAEPYHMHGRARALK